MQQTPGVCSRGVRLRGHFRNSNSLALCAALLLAACGDSQPVGGASVRPGGNEAAAAPTRAEWVDDRLSVDVPIPVVMLGYNDAEIAALQAALPPHTVIHNTNDINQALPPDFEEAQDKQDYTLLLPLTSTTWTVPVLPTAIYQLQAAPTALVAAFEQALAAAKLGETRYDANLVEDFFAAELPKYGVAVNPNAPPLVLLHLAEFGIGAHGWKITGTTGALQPVRLFGARQPLLVWDPSAEKDPYATLGPSATLSSTGLTGSYPYADPLAADATADMAEYITALTEYRMLQGNVLPMPTKPCHAVTGIMAISAASLGEHAPFLRPVEETLVAEHIKQGFDHLTGTETFFDLKLLSMPADDPVLDVLLRLEFPGMELLRGYLSMNFDQYHVAHEGCEPYLSVVSEGDLAEIPGGGILGIGTYDDHPGHRISMSWVHDAFRLLWDPESPVGVQAGGDLQYLNWWEYLFSHETGHLYGMPHPHNMTSQSYEESEPLAATGNKSFSSIWSSMSYQQDGRMIDFGYTDQANYKRNRAGYALREAAAAGREGTPAWNRAMERARQMDWTGVWKALQ